MEELPLGLSLQGAESPRHSWSIGQRRVVLTTERLIVYETDDSWSISRLEDVSSLHASQVENPSQRILGAVLLVFGLIGVIVAMTVNDPYSYYFGQIVAIGSLVVIVAGVAMVTWGARKETFVTLLSGEKIFLTPRGEDDSQAAKEVMTILGDLLAERRHP